MKTLISKVLALVCDDQKDMLSQFRSVFVGTCVRRDARCTTNMTSGREDFANHNELLARDSKLVKLRAVWK
ncbi:hypothetical protein Plhal304r1_c044g0123941 [Plasmopara halstedii]